MIFVACVSGAAPFLAVQLLAPLRLDRVDERHADRHQLPFFLHDFRVVRLGFKFEGLRSWVWGQAFKVKCSGFKVN